MRRSPVTPLLAVLALCLACPSEKAATEVGTVCSQTTLPTAETCNGLDDDCNGLVDDLPGLVCYDGPAGTSGVGLCRSGLRACAEGSLGPCVGEVLPTVERCDGLDDDCDGEIDEALARQCYDGAADTIDPLTGLPKGACQAGVQRCTAGSWGTCAGQVLPTSEDCGGGLGNGIDEDCDGILDDGCACTDGVAEPCYTGPAGTANVGACRAGVRTCGAGSWSGCVGQVLPVPEVCGNGLDEDCDGAVDENPTCCPVPPLLCYEGPTDSLEAGVPRGLCRAGTRACVDGIFGACQGQVLPSPELCDGRDNDCDGVVDEGPPPCVAGKACVNGFCVEESCGVAIQCRAGYVCEASSCIPEACGASVCPVATLCLAGACVDPCASVTCGIGASCADGVCIGGTCYAAGCPGGLICEGGLCVADPCAGVQCEAGTFCRAGDCVPVCALVSCPEGSRCGAGGTCEVDTCHGVSCSPGDACRDGLCVADACWNLSCGAGQACEAGYCVDDPCAHIECPVGICDRGQCY